MGWKKGFDTLIQSKVIARKEKNMTKNLGKINVAYEKKVH